MTRHGLCKAMRINSSITASCYAIIVTLACVYGCAACANAWATRGRHFGWMVFAGVTAFAIAGY